MISFEVVNPVVCNPQLLFLYACLFLKRVDSFDHLIMLFHPLGECGQFDVDNVNLPVDERGLLTGVSPQGIGLSVGENNLCNNTDYHRPDRGYCRPDYSFHYLASVVGWS